MAKKTTRSVGLQRRVVEEYLAGETLHSLARRYNVPRNLIRIWVDRRLYPTQSHGFADAAVFEDIAKLAQAIHECETRIEIIERLAARRSQQSGNAEAKERHDETSRGGVPEAPDPQRPSPPASSD